MGVTVRPLKIVEKFGRHGPPPEDPAGALGVSVRSLKILVEFSFGCDGALLEDAAGAWASRRAPCEDSVKEGVLGVSARP